MQNQQTATTESNPSKTPYWLAAVIVLILASVTLASLLKIKHDSYIAFESKTTTLTSDLKQQLQDRKSVV